MLAIHDATQYALGYFGANEAATTGTGCIRAHSISKFDRRGFRQSVKQHWPSLRADFFDDAVSSVTTVLILPR